MNHEERASSARHVRRRPLLAALLAVALLGTASLCAQEAEEDAVDVTGVLEGAKPAPDSGMNLDQVEQQIVDATNRFRREEELEPLALNAQLDEAAERFAGYMAENDTYGHTADGSTPAGRAKRHGYEYCIVLENIAYEFNSAGFEQEALANGFYRGWKQSPTHRENMLDPDVTETAVAVVRSAETGTYYAVQLFGRPRTDRIEFEVENRADTAVRYRLGGRRVALEPRYTRTHTMFRPAELEFLPGKDSEPSQVYRPSGGEHYVVTSATAESVTIERKQE